ncbi:hypothetical protein EYF80_052069 [Liparis tanakae]|uniref:Uncharacterized protein n=1 Tax=Liparis tanakae TaxID=230148 RepID=A0A4Z2F9A9_9TELE|nr:hypothetical protein EYF80_052069 [Liparis tanakae]
MSQTLKESDLWCPDKMTRNSFMTLPPAVCTIIQMNTRMSAGSAVRARPSSRPTHHHHHLHPSPSPPHPSPPPPPPITTTTTTTPIIITPITSTTSTHHHQTFFVNAST